MIRMNGPTGTVSANTGGPDPLTSTSAGCRHAGTSTASAKGGDRSSLDGSAPEAVDHPQHYGGADNPYEAIKVIEAWDLGFNLGNTVKYVARSERKGAPIEDLRKAAWYLAREIANREAGQ